MRSLFVLIGVMCVGAILIPGCEPGEIKLEADAEPEVDYDAEDETYHIGTTKDTVGTP